MAKGLTAAAVERLKAAPTKRREVPDAGMPGLYLLVQPSGGKAWAVRYRFNGKSAKHTIGRWPAFGVADARREAGEILQQVDRGEDPARLKRERKIAEASAVDFATAIRLWID